MRRCPALRGSGAISAGAFRQPRLQCRLFTSTKAPAKEHGNSNNRQTPRFTNDADAESDSLFNDWEQAFQIDPDAKTIETAVGSLPLSPVMDPSFWAQREQFTKRKPKHTPSKPQSALERQFGANPFAQALATPVRYESITRIRLPSFFFQDFHLVTHPETGQPWWIPQSLALDNSNHSKAKDNEGSDSQMSAQEEQGSAQNEAATSHSSTIVRGNTQKKKPSKRMPLGPKAYGPARKDVLAALTRDKSGFYQQHRALFGPSSSQYKAFSGKAVWRQDMDEFVLDLMRRHIEQDLLYLSRLCVEQSRYYIVKCFGWGDVQYKHKGAVLWFGSSADEGETTTKKEEDPPGPFATFEFSDGEGAKRAVAVHNMPMLLDEETAARVRKEAGALQDGSIFMLGGRRTADLQLKLWKLQGYLSDYR
ncbi:hypothetical protein PGQ11_012048 [Apiospora arundinis]|uniref:Esterase-like protein n=1 Tax=Apiospora arundinis TaxID=335852 RepID=A0ABR2I1D6_9PEZI